MSERLYLSSAVAARIGVRRGVLGALALSLSVNLFLSAALALHHTEVRTIIMPPGVKAQRYVFEEQAPSDNYLQAFALSALTTLTNVTPASVDAAVERLLSIVAPSAYGELSLSLQKEAAAIKANRSSTLFYPETVSVEREHLRVSIEGEQKTLIGSEVTSTHKKRFFLQFLYSAGQLFLESVREDAADRASPHARG